MNMEDKLENSAKMVYGIIGNIPPDYHSSDLRNFFSQFIESGGFKCFHYRHRPELKKTEKGSCLKNDLTNTQSNCVTMSMEKNQRKKTTCCIVQLEESKMIELLRMYHKKHWIDKKGDSIPALCFISKIKISEPKCQNKEYLTRKESKQTPLDREEFTLSDLANLAELHPPALMPNGNVGTKTLVFLEFIQQCKLPPIIIRKLGLTFPKTRSNRKYGNVPFDYNAEVYDGPPLEEEIVKASTGKELESENNFISEGKTISHASPSLINEQSKSPLRRKGKIKKTMKLPTKRKVEEESGEETKEQSESDSDDCEEWDRHNALNDDPANIERNKERLFEEDLEVQWEKGGSGLVFYTDAQYWDQQRGDFDEKTADDWDVDMSEYVEPGTGDKDARDFIKMREETRRRHGEDTDIVNDKGIGMFEKYSKGIGSRVMKSQGWKEGDGLGKTAPGITDALDNDGQGPRDKSGLGYYGEKLSRHPVRKRRHGDGGVIISTVHDDPQDTDPAELLRRRAEPHNIKYRLQYQFVKAGLPQAAKLPQTM